MRFPAAFHGLYLRFCAQQVSQWQRALRVERDKGYIDAALERMEQEAASRALEIDRLLRQLRSRARSRAIKLATGP